MKVLMTTLALAAFAAAGAEPKLNVLIIDGVNNHDWAAGTRYIRSILEGTGRFHVDVSTHPAAPPDLKRYQAIINNFNGGHTKTGMRWPREVERALVDYVRNGGGLVNFHAANNAFLVWPEYNEMIGLGWRDPSFGASIAIGRGGEVVTIPKGTGLPPGHGPRQDFRVFVRDSKHPITQGLPAHWLHPSEQLTHGQHGPAQGIDVLTYAFSEVSQQGEPMDWVRTYGRGRVYTTMLGHTWKNEPNPNLEDPHFQALLARGVEWAATGKVQLPADLGWKPLLNGKNLDGWENRGESIWTVNPNGVLLGQRNHAKPNDPFQPVPWPVDQKQFGLWLGRQAWLYTIKEYTEFDLHLEYWLPREGNSGISIRDRSRAHFKIGEPDSVRPELAGFPKDTPAHIGYEIQIIDVDATKFPTGSIYTFAAAKTGVHRPGEWNSMDVESRNERIRIRVNGMIVAESPGDPKRSKTGPIGLQLHDQFTFIQFRNIRIREDVH
jgi:type 1 glutamine amidotransferase